MCVCVDANIVAARYSTGLGENVFPPTGLGENVKMLPEIVIACTNMFV